MSDCSPNPWALYPFPPVFWSRPSVQAIAPELAYVGPLPQRDRDMLKIQTCRVHDAYVYVISDTTADVLYVGKTVNPTGRFSKHGTSRRQAEVAALQIEALAIRDLMPHHNVVGSVR